MIEFEPLDLTDIGLTPDRLDLTLPDDLPIAFPIYVPRHGPAPHWETTAAEEHHLDMPAFTSHADRARHFITAMARRALANAPQGATEADEALPHGERLVSLTELLRGVDEPVIGSLPDMGIK